jgi:hypothetical protein
VLRRDTASRPIRVHGITVFDEHARSLTLVDVTARGPDDALADREDPVCR